MYSPFYPFHGRLTKSKHTIDIIGGLFSHRRSLCLGLRGAADHIVHALIRDRSIDLILELASGKIRLRRSLASFKLTSQQRLYQT